jgi:hypothetical protein
LQFLRWFINSTSGKILLINATLLDQLIEPFADCLTTEAADKVVALKAEDSLQLRIDELAEKANQGTLTPTEQKEYDRYLAAFHFVTVMQARARRLLHT